MAFTFESVDFRGWENMVDNTKNWKPSEQKIAAAIDKDVNDFEFDLVQFEAKILELQNIDDTTKNWKPTPYFQKPTIINRNIVLNNNYEEITDNQNNKIKDFLKECEKYNDIVDKTE